MSLPAYAELHCLSAFSFGRGASSAQELFARAKHCGYTALALTDECSLAGIVRAWEASKATGLPLIVGSELRLADGPTLVVLVEDAAGYGSLCQQITRARRAAPKGQYHLTRHDLQDGLPGCCVLWVPDAVPDPGAGRWVRETFPGRSWLAIELHRGPDDAARCAELEALGRTLDLPCVAAGDVHMHVRSRRMLQDVLTATRHHRLVAEAGGVLFPNGERHLRTRTALAAIYPSALLAETGRIAARCRFDLGCLSYAYPHELVPEGLTPTQWLAQLTRDGAAWRWPGGTPAQVQAQIDHELALIAELRYEAFFLTVHDIVRYARSRQILCQGRGSAANSAVCFCLGITEVDPARMSMLFERFLSRERNEPPDIDVDFEHERREEVLQYIYAKYGRERAALAATVIRYQPRSAVRDAGKALGLGPDQVHRLSRAVGHSLGDDAEVRTRLAAYGLDADTPVMRRVLAVTRALVGLPRHLSQHVGGFVIAEQPLHTLVPVENAAMADRTLIQWDKDDLDALGLLKVDCLALGMLSALRRCLALLRAQRGLDLAPATIPAEDPATYAMIQRADTIGTFQVESRAQMAMLPRLKPATFYDLVIQIAIVRPGPIQGRMVHPYLRRRQGLESIEYPSKDLEAVFARTLGVPLFQEQVMQLAIIAAGFSPGEADHLRRGMAAWKRHGDLGPFRARILDGMAARGYEAAFAEQVFEQIKGFGSYGFPESHAASFALIAYVSCWLKCHQQAAFTCAMLNAQPLGFYSPDQLIQDARRHGVEVRPVDVSHSDWDCTLEDVPEELSEQPALRLGLRQVAGLAESDAVAIMAARRVAPLRDVEDLCQRAGLDARVRGLLAGAGALRALAGHRHKARWAVEGIEARRPLLDGLAGGEAEVTLPNPSVAQDLRADYASMGFTLGPHPLALLRRELTMRRCRRSSDLATLPHGSHVRVAGLVTLRQRPQTASGVTFMTLEDEAGMVNVVVWRDLATRQRLTLVESRMLAVDGRLESVDGVQHLIAHRLHDFSNLIDGLGTKARDFR